MHSIDETIIHLFHPRKLRFSRYTIFLWYIKTKYITQTCEVHKKVECVQEVYEKCLQRILSKFCAWLGSSQHVRVSVGAWHMLSMGTANFRSIGTT